MRITSTQNFPSRASRAPLETAPSNNTQPADEPVDSVSLSSSGNRTAATVLGYSLLGGAVAATPFLGALSSSASASLGAEMGNPITTMSGLYSGISNVVASTFVLSGGSHWLMAIPAALGAVSWAGVGYESAKFAPANCGQ